MSFESDTVLIPDYLTIQAEKELLDLIRFSMRFKKASNGEGRSRIIRYGWDYENEAWLGDPPPWMPAIQGADSWTINEYPRGHFISPHVDSPRFDDEIHILSLGVSMSMVFTPTIGPERVVELPPRSLFSMRGAVRREWKHSTLPTDEGVRYSIVFRRKM